MKKMNKKGFTLIELLAVIVVLGIILVITIPTVLGAINGAEDKAFKSSANAAASWYEQQYSYCKLGDSTIAGDAVSNEYIKLTDGYDASTGKTDDCKIATAKSLGDSLKIAGLSADDVDSSSTVKIGSDGRACVTLTAKSGGKFTGNATSSGC